LAEGQVVNRNWLKIHGFSRHRIDYALRAGKLESVAHGVYRKPGPPLKWEHIVFSLIEMGHVIHVGGQSALELQGFAHYIPVGSNQKITLYGKSKLPSWVTVFSTQFQFEIYTRRLFSFLPQNAIHSKLFGAWDWKIPYSTPELALVELLSDIQDAADFSMADKFFEGAVNLRPDLISNLLQDCTQVKAKRLFLWFSDRHGHSWRLEIKTDGIDLGRGKRMLIKGGSYDATYKITVPKEMTFKDEPSLY
jgi:hypothetical protein